MDVVVEAEMLLIELPATLLHVILLWLPSDERARAATVCRTLRDVVSHPALWTEVDLTRGGGVTCKINPNALLALAPRLAHTRVLRMQP